VDKDTGKRYLVIVYFTLQIKKKEHWELGITGRKRTEKCMEHEAKTTKKEH